MAELKPCPFCGGKAELIQTKCLSNGCVLYHVFHYDLKCPTNGIRTDNRQTAEEAIEAWNRRADYKDVAIALETENRHYQDLIAYMKDAEYQRLDENRADHIDRGKFLGQCAMTAKILEYFMEITGAADDHRIHMGIEDLAAVCTAAWMDLQGMEPVDG